MSLTNPNTPVSQQDLQDFYHKLLPYMGGSSEGGGHTIEDAEGTDLTQRDTLQFGEGFKAEDDSTNEKTVVDIDPMPAEDMDDVIDELPTGGNIAVTGYVPLGTLIPFYGETAPKFFLACDGSTYNKADYPELANHLLSLTYNTPYIVDGDNTKFKVPDLRGEFIRGTGTNSYTNQGSGSNVGEHQDGTEHVDFGFDQNANSNIYVNSNKITIGNTLSSIKTDTQLRDATKTGGSWFTRGGTYTANGIYGYTSRPTNTSVLFCIAYKDIYSNPMNDYSTTEKVVGTWIDGKPLYQRTFVKSSGITSDFYLADLSNANIDKIISGEGWWTRLADGIITQFPYGRTETPAYTNYDVNIRYMGDVKKLRVIIGGYPVSQVSEIRYTLQYTKTTD